MKRPTETVADFKQRIAILMRQRETGQRYSIIGGPRAAQCVVRGKGDRPTPSEQKTRKGKAR
jgi:hypothetical protein